MQIHGGPIGPISFFIYFQTISLMFNKFNQLDRPAKPIPQNKSHLDVRCIAPISPTPLLLAKYPSSNLKKVHSLYRQILLKFYNIDFTFKVPKGLFLLSKYDS